MKSAQLVDPELVPNSGRFPSFDFHVATLPAMRAEMASKAVAALPAEDSTVLVSSFLVPGPMNAPDVRVVAYRPAGSTGILPVLLHFHGGGYVVGSPERKGASHRVLARQLDCAIYSVDYRLAPEAPFPAAIEDAYAVLRWLSVHARQQRIDPDRIGAIGESAGGGLVASLALLVRDRGELSLAFQHLISPMLDDRTANHPNSNAYACAGEFAWTHADNAFGWKSLLGAGSGSHDVSPYAAAARAVDVRGLPAAFVSVAALDLLLPEELAYAGRLMAAGVSTELHVYPGAYHGFAPLFPGARVSKAAERDSLDAIRRAFYG